MRNRLNFYGGETAIDRLNGDKVRSLRAALKSSYQSVLIELLPSRQQFQCLINSDKLKPDYDNKVVSIEKEAGIVAGSVFRWIDTNTYWIVYLQELTETAYFRSAIRRCRYSIPINGTDYYVYIQGPTETDIKWYQKAGVVWNQPNYSLSMYVTKNSDTLEFFQRFNTLELEGNVWRIEAVDTISVEGLIEVELGEHFNNPYEDLQTTPTVEPIVPGAAYISGEVFVKPYDIQTYTIVDATGGVWILDTDLARINSSTSESVEIEILTGKSGSFDIIYRTDEDITLHIIIESL